MKSPGFPAAAGGAPTGGLLLAWLALTLGFVGLAVLAGRAMIRAAAAVHAEPFGMRSSQPFVRWYQYLNPAVLALDLYRHRHVLSQLTRRDVEGRYRGSALGLLWSLATPLVMLAIYTFVFSAVFRIRWPGEGGGSVDFAVTLFAGLIAFNLFSECVGRAPGLIAGNASYVRRIVFPLEVLPVSVLGGALFHLAVNAGVLLAGLAISHHRVPATIVLLPLAVLPLAVLTLGVSWFLASLGVYVRDTGYAVALVIQMLFFLTPLFYPAEAAPERFRALLWINPLTAVVDTFRRVAVWGQPPDWGAFALLCGVSFAALLLGYSWFMKTKAGFANVI